MTLKVGDIIVNQRSGNRRQITAVRSTGYQWKYPDWGGVCPNGSENSFMSENSNNEFFDWDGWVLETLADNKR